MDLDDFGGAIAGCFGGLVKWYQDPHKVETATERVVALATSTAAGGIFGYFTQAFIQWRFPDVPYNMSVAFASLAGLTSGILSQSLVGVANVVVYRARAWIEAKFPLPPGHDGSAAATQPGPKQPS